MQIKPVSVGPLIFCADVGGAPIRIAANPTAPRTATTRTFPSLNFLNIIFPPAVFFDPQLHRWMNICLRVAKEISNFCSTLANA
jgi:hypothetical protein